MKTEQKPYRCPVCGRQDGAEEDRLRTHCPNCLSGLHGEREDGLECGGVLEPVGIWVKSDKEWEIIQRCRLCGEMTSDPMSGGQSCKDIINRVKTPFRAALSGGKDGRADEDDGRRRRHGRLFS